MDVDGPKEEEDANAEPIDATDLLKKYAKHKITTGSKKLYLSSSLSKPMTSENNDTDQNASLDAFYSTKVGNMQYNFSKTK